MFSSRSADTSKIKRETFYASRFVQIDIAVAFSNS